METGQLRGGEVNGEVQKGSWRDLFHAFLSGFGNREFI